MLKLHINVQKQFYSYSYFIITQKINKKNNINFYFGARYPRESLLEIFVCFIFQIPGLNQAFLFHPSFCIPVFFATQTVSDSATVLLKTLIKNEMLKPYPSFFLFYCKNLNILWFLIMRKMIKCLEEKIVIHFIFL